MSYVDGFVIPVPRSQKDAYLAMARQVGPIMREYGALEVVECWGDGDPSNGSPGFRSAVAADKDEEIVLSWILWPDKVIRDAGNAAALSDARLHLDQHPLFNPKRMICGGFTPILRLGGEAKE